MFLHFKTNFHHDACGRFRQKICPMMTITPVVKQLLIINILFFIGSYFVPVAYDLFALYYPENDGFKIWQLITHMFMHAPFPNVSHILFNMFALYSFGSALEHFWGWKKILVFLYFLWFRSGFVAYGGQLYRDSFFVITSVKYEFVSFRNASIIKYGL